MIPTDNTNLSKLLSFSNAKQKLLSSLIGLVRASVENESATENTDMLIARSVSLLDSGADIECEDKISEVRREKSLLAPDCAVCPNPCGRTADYPISEFVSENAELQELKAKMLFDILKDTTHDIENLKKRLFMFGYEKDVEGFKNFTEEV